MKLHRVKPQNKEGLFSRNNGKVFSYLLYITIFFLSGFLFYRLFLELIFAWGNDPEFTHGYLIPFISIFLIWNQRIKLRTLLELKKPSSPKYSNIALLVVILCICSFIVCRYTNVVLIEGISFVSIVLASILFVYGINIFKITLFPILYLLFMLPIPARILSFFSEPLQYLITKGFAWILLLFNVPFLLEGELIYLVSITLHVEEACAGLRSLMAFSAIGLVYAYLFIRSNLFKVLIVILSIILAVIMNLIRVSAIGIFAYYFSNEMGLKIHEYGWTLTSILGFLIIFLMGWAFKCIESRKVC